MQAIPGERRSSSNDLSSVPDSDFEGPVPVSTTSTPLASLSHLPTPQDDSTVVAHSGTINYAENAHTAPRSTPATGPADSRQDSSLPKTIIRRPRKKKEAPPGEVEKEKEKKPRKPRAASGTAATARKKLKVENDSSKAEPTAFTPDPEDPSRAAKPPAHLSSSLLNSASAPALIEAAKPSQFGLVNEQSKFYDPTKTFVMNESKPAELHPPITPRSSAIYDPVRSITQLQRPPEPVRPTSVAQTTQTTQTTQTPPRPLNRASASPAISSIIDPPVTDSYATLPPVSNGTRAEERQTHESSVQPAKDLEAAMEIDPPSAAESGAKKPSLVKKPSSDDRSGPPSPKPARAKEQPPPLPQGSGLLSSSLFGGEAKSDGPNAGDKGQNIVLHIDLKGQTNQVINFARMAEEKYGFAALHPRQAAQRERMARIAAAGAALERSANSSKMGGSAGDSGDEDLSVDIDRDSENDGDINMSGINGGNETGANSGTDGPTAPKRRRRRKIEEYDAEDPFVDDSEMIWEAQAAASKDGFFVYCGPLVPEGEKPAVERADGTVKRGRGRGRGGGPGSRGGRGGAAAAAAVASEAGSGRAGGPGSRGGTTTRKPRMTKADRAMREQEKAYREKMATLAAKPPGYPT